MSALEIVDRYYDAWQNGRGDFGDVPLAEDFVFRGPVASFDSAEAYRAMAERAAPMVTRFDVRHQFVDGDRVCSIVDWEMSLPVAPMTSAEILEVAGGEIVRGELIYDAEELRAALAQAGEAPRRPRDRVARCEPRLSTRAGGWTSTSSSPQRGQVTRRRFAASPSRTSASSISTATGCSGRCTTPRTSCRRSCCAPGVT